MPQGQARKLSNENIKQKSNKKVTNPPSKKHWSKRKDPVRAALIRKVEGIAMEKALKAPMNGGMKLIKANEKQAAVGTISTKDLIKNPKSKPKVKKEKKEKKE